MVELLPGSLGMQLPGILALGTQRPYCKKVKQHVLALPLTGPAELPADGQHHLPAIQMSPTCLTANARDKQPRITELSLVKLQKQER